MIRIWRAPWSTNCERVSIALGHKGLEAESVMIDYSDRSEVERVSGQPLVPVIEDEGEVIADSVAIMRHLERKYPDPPLFPADEQAAAEVDLFIEWFNEVWKVAPNTLESELDSGTPNLAIVDELERRIDRDLDLFERLVERREYFRGDFGAADIVAYPHLKYAAGRPAGDDELFHVILDERQSVKGRPNLAAWIERVGSRPRAF